MDHPRVTLTLACLSQITLRMSSINQTGSFTQDQLLTQYLKTSHVCYHRLLKVFFFLCNLGAQGVFIGKRYEPWNGRKLNVLTCLHFFNFPFVQIFLCVLLLWRWVPAVGMKPLFLVLFKNHFPLLLPRIEDDLSRWMFLLSSSGTTSPTQTEHISHFTAPSDPLLLKLFLLKKNRKLFLTIKSLFPFASYTSITNTPFLLHHAVLFPFYLITFPLIKQTAT